MKHHSSRIAPVLGGLLLAGSPLALAEHVIVKGTTVSQQILVNYLASTGTTTRTTDSSKLQQYGVYSSLGNTGYAYYTLNTAEKYAFKSTGNFATGPTLFANYSGSGRAYEVHNQFNKQWNEDIPGLGDTTDLFHLKTGTLEGTRSLIQLPQAGFQIQAAPKLTGFHTHTTWSNEFGYNPALKIQFAPGRFLRVDSSRSNFKLDVKLTDQTNDLGGSLANGITVAEQYLISKGYMIIPVDPLPF